MAPRYRLKLDRLDFISAVDVPAQETAKTLLMKRGGGIEARARVAKLSEELGLVFCWAFTSTTPDGEPYHDLQGDAIDPDFIKSAADYMSGTRAVDGMHDGKQTGHVVFAMPMTPEIAAAYGVTSKTVGLMVALKPSPEDFAKFKSGEYTGVSIAGMGTREHLEKRRVTKQSVLTDLVDGHQHALDVDAPADRWCGDRLSTTYQTAEGATESHSHVWIFDETTGAITVAADSGHTHTVADVVPADALAAYAALDAQEDAENAAVAAAPVCVPEPITDEPSSGKTIVVIASRAPVANKSTRTAAASQPALTSPESLMSTEHDKTIADLTAKLSKAERLATLTDAQRAHYSALGNDGEAYLAKSFADRQAVIADIEKANEIVYTSKSTSEVFRKNDDPRLITMAKRQDEQAVELAKRDEAIEKAEIRSIAKATLGTLTGSDDVHDLIIKAVRKSGADAKLVDEALTAMKGWHVLAKAASVAKGVNPGADPSETSPAIEWDAAVAKLAADKSISVAKATEMFGETEKGKQLYGEMQKAKKARA